MLLDKDKSCLVVVDVQEKLTPKVIHAKSMVNRCEWLMRLASELDVPVLVCEQYPKGLGYTIEPLRGLLPMHVVIEKQSFSAYRDPHFQQEWQNLHRKQVILVGIETHVCILQTALDLVDAGAKVFVVLDAISARHLQDHHAALERMKQAGVTLITSEMIFYEWIKQAGSPVFKTLNQAFMKMEQEHGA
ncbi:MAG TPA: hydrolase [Legionellales bacterium]|jgi:nicotinamidase-related amidase|nr:hydrolase [Legionellales bacterium]